ncbi:hypothetical protein SAMN05216387_10145 [Nitrosovibrio tenuis]|uniref:Transposase n=1 Tax=Nitrosovibrio tenuis TaxID=1233 RepID=A0A1H7FNK5_9PROT|nr:hypothetical protein SAMN05216387_10145 [Nitrosovibrio tenuis]
MHIIRWLIQHGHKVYRAMDRTFRDGVKKRQKTDAVIF